MAIVYLEEDDDAADENPDAALTISEEWADRDVLPVQISSRVAHFTSMTFASPRLLNKLTVTSPPCRWSLTSRRELPRLNWFKMT